MDARDVWKGGGRGGRHAGKGKGERWGGTDNEWRNLNHTLMQWDLLSVHFFACFFFKSLSICVRVRAGGGGCTQKRERERRGVLILTKKHSVAC